LFVIFFIKYFVDKLTFALLLQYLLLQLWCIFVHENTAVFL
jgi:hypothetical protein